jgi:hypothetical protein
MYYIIQEWECGGGNTGKDCNNTRYISDDFKSIICMSCGSAYNKPFRKLEIRKQIEIDKKTFMLLKGLLKITKFYRGWKYWEDF